jgi:hypothetical protein
MLGRVFEHAQEHSALDSCAIDGQAYRRPGIVQALPHLTQPLDFAHGVVEIGERVIERCELRAVFGT